MGCQPWTVCFGSLPNTPVQAGDAMCTNAVINQGAMYNVHKELRHLYHTVLYVYYMHVHIKLYCTVCILYPCMYSCTYLTADNCQGLQVHHKLTERHDLHFFFKPSYKLQCKVSCVCTYVHTYIAALLRR